MPGEAFVEVYISKPGCRGVLFLQVAAHELAHAWQGENCPVLDDTLIHEGFAEWVSYQVLGEYAYAQAQEIMRARSDIYGQGLRRLLDIEASQGVDGVFRLCRAID